MHVSLAYAHQSKYLHQPGVVKITDDQSAKGLPSGNIGLIYRNRIHGNKPHASTLVNFTKLKFTKLKVEI